MGCFRALLLRATMYIRVYKNRKFHRTRSYLSRIFMMSHKEGKTRLRKRTLN